MLSSPLRMGAWYDGGWVLVGGSPCWEGGTGTRGLPRPALVTRVEGARQQLHPGIPGIHQLTELRAIPEETKIKFMSQQKAKDSSSDVNKRQPDTSKPPQGYVYQDPP